MIGEQSHLAAADPAPFVSYGSIHHIPGMPGKTGNFVILAAPHVRAAMRRFFVAAKDQGHEIKIGDTIDNATSLQWFMLRYPLRSVEGALAKVDELAAIGKAREEKCTQVLNMAEAPAIGTILPLRDYQVKGVHLLAAMRSLLVGDDVGLGKTVIAAGAMAEGAFPAIVVCQTHLPTQWALELEKFVPGVKIAVAKKGHPHPLPKHNVLIISYTKLSGWKDALDGYKMIVFDEAQELRGGTNTGKGAAADAIARQCAVVLSLTATPVYNYGDEIFNVLDITTPGCLGSRDEFRKEWCEFNGKKYIVRDPKALGSMLAAQYLFLRRRREDVGRELPPVNTVVQAIDYDHARINGMQDRTLLLAKAVLNGSFEERGMAARQLSALMRQQTGIAKAPFVAELVADMVKSGEKVVLTGWHREVYEVWKSVFDRLGIPFVLYTGSESPTQKNAAVQEFTRGKAQVFVMSLRSGAGLNELQKVSRVIVHGELDWSPQVHYQCTGRLNRDEQLGQVTEIYLVSEAGSDPTVAHVLGVKKWQSDGIIDPDKIKADDPIGAQSEVSNATELAKAVLQKYHGKS